MFTKRSPRHSQSMSLRCVLKSRKRDPESGKTNNTSEYCRLLHDALVHLKGERLEQRGCCCVQWHRRPCAVEIAHLRKADQKETWLIFEGMGNDLRTYLRVGDTNRSCSCSRMKISRRKNNLQQVQKGSKIRSEQRILYFVFHNYAIFLFSLI